MCGTFEKMSKTITVGPDHRLTSKLVSDIAHHPDLKIELSTLAKKRVVKSRQIVEQMVKKQQVVYGITTGFGNFKSKVIPLSQVAELQQNLIRSHAVGVGEPFSPPQARSAIIARINSLAQGHSGIRLELLELLIAILNKNIVPVIPSQGSVGASGDLAPLSHLALVLIGEGQAWYQGKLLSGKEALNAANLSPITLAAKEGLALNNGTSIMAGLATLAISEAERLIKLADLACALTVEAIAGTTNAFDKRVHAVRPHPGQIISAANISLALRGSRLVNSDEKRIQDSYSIRCSPQVHGAVKDTIGHVGRVVEIELNSATDNPLIFSDPSPVAVSGGNFHGEPIAIAMDSLGIAISELANISERRIAKLVDAATNEGLPPFLVPPEKAGLHSGLMIAQYTAAALVSENKVLAHPASVDSIPTSANQEDHVSMGTIATRKILKIIEHTTKVLAIEFLTAAQAVDFINPDYLGLETKKIYQHIRKSTPFINDDRILANDINKICQNIIRKYPIDKKIR